MAVNITTSNTLGGNAFSDVVDLGSLEPNETISNALDIFITHDSLANDIEDCVLYIYRYSGPGVSYQGDDEDEDISYILDWGSENAGVSMCMDHTGWTPGSELAGTWEYLTSSDGAVGTPRTLSEDSIVGTPGASGEIPQGETAHIQIKLKIPDAPGTTGYKAFSLVFAYSEVS